jgi:soluble lytic murein transglycosylase-like protein
VDAFAVQVERVFGVRAEVAEEFSPWILEASTRHELNPALIASVVFTESSFRKHVTSHVGAIGPAQVRPYWKDFCGSTSLSDPDENIYCGAQILSHFKQDCGADTCALAAYNVGPRNTDHELFGEPGRRYVNKIDRHLARFDNTVL